MNRRVFQFGLRTVFVLVTLACVWLAYNANLVHARKSAEKEAQKFAHLERSETLRSGGKTMPWLRRLMGDKYISEMQYSTSTPARIVNQFERHFPEAHLLEIEQGISIYVEFREDENAVLAMGFGLDDKGFATQGINVIRADGHPLTETVLGEALIVDGKRLRVERLEFGPPMFHWVGE